jgi:protein-disulfide isomerase
MRLVALASATVLLCLADTAANIDPAKAIGLPSAPITMEVFSSFDCPHCKEFDEDTVPQLRRDFIDRGKLYLVNRAFPLMGHPYARQAADYATAAARIGKYQQVANALWAKQSQWAVNGQVWPVVASVLTLPEQNKVQALVKSPEVRAEVQRDLDQGLAAGINETPTLIIIHNGRRTPIVGAPRYDLLRGYLDSLLAK